MYLSCYYNSLDELFEIVPFKGFSNVADNIRYLYSTIRPLNGVELKLPFWIEEKYFFLFHFHNQFNCEKLI